VFVLILQYNFIRISRGLFMQIII